MLNVFCAHDKINIVYIIIDSNKKYNLYKWNDDLKISRKKKDRFVWVNNK